MVGLSTSLYCEYANKGVDVQVVLPGLVVSKLSGVKKSSIAAPNPETFVRSALRTVGIYMRTSGYWIHEFQVRL